MADKKWYVIYTKSRAEKKVYQKLTGQNIETFLPLQKTMRQWSDRKKTVEVPLFNSYVFVKITETDFYKVLQTDGVVYFISFNGEKAVVPEQVIIQLKLIIKGKVPVDLSKEKFEKGDYVEVERGPLKELKGYLVTYHGKHKVLIRIDVINQNLLLEIPASFLRKVYQKSV
ncbi:MAG: UpxY family transcription antiterminator [Chlorobi bacterium]|nr:UpxY family transcription antiterminator [Chlorobiota bacterium]